MPLAPARAMPGPPRRPVLPWLGLALLWAAAVLLVFVPLANAQYRRSTSR